jgi:hypothetical protein
MYQCSRKRFIVAKKLYEWSNNVSHYNPEIASVKKKKAPLLLHCTKNDSKQNKADLARELTGDVGAFFLYY